MRRVRRKEAAPNPRARVVRFIDPETPEDGVRLAYVPSMSEGHKFCGCNSALPHSVDVIRNVVAWVFVTRGQGEARGGEEFTDKCRDSKFLALTSSGAEVVCGDAYLVDALKCHAATGQSMA